MLRAPNCLELFSGYVLPAAAVKTLNNRMSEKMRAKECTGGTTYFRGRVAYMRELEEPTLVRLAESGELVFRSPSKKETQ